MDKYPTEKRMINIVTILFECGIVNRIKAKSSINADEMQKFLTQIENEYGISAQYSQEAIMIWATAFDITVSVIKKTQMVKLASVDIMSHPENKPVVYVQGNINDYDVEQKADGYYITHFDGFEEEEMVIPSLINGKPIKGIASYAFRGCVMVKKIKISEGIEFIEDSAFEGCSHLIEILLPETLVQIGDNSAQIRRGAFTGTALKTITIPKNVKNIGSYTFAHTNLQYVITPDDLEFLGTHAFWACYNLKKVALSDNITKICDYTFDDCCNLSEIKLPKGLLTIKKGAFRNCSCLSNIELPQDLLTIEAFAFEGCKYMSEIHIPMGTQVIGKGAFSGCQLTDIYIPPTVTNIEDIFGSHMTNRSKLTIHCAAGSAAMQYARKYRLKCVQAQF